ncbi:Putative porin [Mucilaginibacter pineti]|uniref:Putative porin n=1 Tax=Mucilaginibacter pineti TaxID=1391627 RepID=A0A1G7BTM9_9SPHI|nr:putative porin [Mucilaginibacter pineti]SDE30322.1 Putative porin [Mucilaginibacter pineti]
MHKKLKYILLLLMCISVRSAFAQYNNPAGQRPRPLNMRDTVKKVKEVSDDELLDSLRKKEENKRDSVIFNSKFIRITNADLLNDSTQTFAIDTGITNFENYSVLLDPRNPRIHLGYTGVSQRSLLFEPYKNIGFDAGQHALDIYALAPEDIRYYNARVPLTTLSLFNGFGSTAEQIFKIQHTQNIKENWNVGFNLNFNGSRGFYSTQSILQQNVSDVNAAIYTWYESKGKRYNLLANIIYNNLKAPETGSILNDSVFTSSSNQLYFKNSAAVRLPNSYENWKERSFFIKQFYYIGRIDSLGKQKGKANSTVLPTQRVAHTFFVQSKTYNYRQTNQPDTYHVFPDYYYSVSKSNDSLNVTDIRNEFSYSFYLRSKAAKASKNELKLDLALVHDLYHYAQYVSDTTMNEYGLKYIHQERVQSQTFQDITLKGKLSYRLSDRIGLEGDVKQIAQGRDFGNYYYGAKLTLSGGKKAGRIILEAFSQNSSPPLIYNNWISNHYIFHNDFSNQKTTSASFNYINNPLELDIKAEYFLISNYLYFIAQPGGVDAHPAQLGSSINLLKVSIGKNLTWRKLHFDNYAVYQKTDYQSTLRTPELYTYSNLYYSTLLFNVLQSSVGVNVRYNTQYVAPSYAVGIGQFYNGPDVTFSSYPVAAVYFKATLQRTNLFLMYDYANQKLSSKGYYTVNRYPQQDALIKFGVSWTFYN